MVANRRPMFFHKARTFLQSPGILRIIRIEITYVDNIFFNVDSAERL